MLQCKVPINIHINCLYFRQLRGKLPSKILISLCSSMIIFLVVFLGGIEQSKHRISCQVIAAILHYFMMTSFAWMCVAAVNLYMLLVLIFRKGSDDRFFIRASTIAWGMIIILFLIYFCRRFEACNKFEETTINVNCKLIIRYTLLAKINRPP